MAEQVKVMRETVRGKVVNGWRIALDMGRYGSSMRRRKKLRTGHGRRHWSTAKIGPAKRHHMPAIT
jgi:hypothetical protein